VYVVLSLWKERASVVGVGADLASAEEIADRLGVPYLWGDWWISVNPDSGIRGRGARWADGSLHPDHQQKIVRVPLAGMVKVPPPGEVVYETGGIIDVPLGMDRIIGSASAPNVTPQPAIPPGLTVDRLKQVIAELHGNRGVIDEARVGDGPAWEWLKAGLDRLTTYPSAAPMPDSRAAAMIWGIPIRLDPNMPKDEIHMGDTVFIVGSEEGRVRPGTVVRIDQAELRRAVQENTVRDLRKHLRLGRDDPGYRPGA